MACGSGTQTPSPRTPDVGARSLAPEPEAPRGPSPYERRWLGACKEGGVVGRCPAPFDKPAVFLDVDGEGDYEPPAFCETATPDGGADVRAALAAERKALRACLRGADDGAWIEVGPDGAAKPAEARGLPPRAAGCVQKIVQRVQSGRPALRSDRVVVLKGGGAKGHAGQALSKQSLDAVIAQHAGEVNACYDGALEVWPGLKGRVAPSVVIWFDGSVVLVRTGQSALDNPALECCINTAISGWRFGKPEGGSIAIVSLPFTLGPAAAP